MQVNRYHEFTAIRQKKSLYIEFLYNNKNLYHIHLQWMVTETEASTNPKQFMALHSYSVLSSNLVTLDKKSPSE